MVSKIGTVHAHTVVCVYQGEDNANPHHQCKNCGVCSSTRRQRRLPLPPLNITVVVLIGAAYQRTLNNRELFLLLFTTNREGLIQKKWYKPRKNKRKNKGIP
mmetsp:Transcript_34912/g.39214  ORF Transcript_34912/g.39214 Transcript_34912/m.39214 type:complete len:102 (-) Transcript_34912:183-488(-)